MDFSNFTPFPGIAWENVDATNKWYCTIVARVRFTLQETSNTVLTPVLAKDQGALFTSDVFDEESGVLLYESDYVSYKKTTDVVLNAKAFTPTDEEEYSFECNVEIYSETDELLKYYPLVIKAQQSYKKEKNQYKKIEPQKVKELDITYAKAKGGSIVFKEEGKEDLVLAYDEYNPIGCGISHPKDQRAVRYEPQIVYKDEKHTDVPAGYGFINRAYTSRLELAGTYDEKWVETQHPLPPKDFSYRHNQAAHPYLIMDNYLKEGTRFELTNLFKERKKVTITLPKLQVIARVSSNTRTITKEMPIDTVLLDINKEDVKDNSIYISYRIQIPTNQEELQAQLLLIQEEKELSHG